MKICEVCGKEHSSVAYEICFRCRDAQSREIQMQKEQKELKKEKEKKEIEDRIKNYKDIIVSTTHTLENYSIEKYLGIESAEVIVGTNVVKDFFSNINDFIGARSKGYENSLSIAKQQAFEILKYKCAIKGGNAVIGIDIDYIEIGNKSMLGVIVNGTIVQIKKI